MMRPGHLASSSYMILSAALLIISLVISQSQNSARAADYVCNHTIGSDITKADGLTNYSAVRPGDTVCITAGTRGSLHLSNFQGTSGHPITFINHTGKVIINAQGNWVALQIINSQHIRLTGTGDPATPYGFELFNAPNAGLIARLQTRYFEFDHIEIYGVGAGIRAGTKLVDAPTGWVQYGTHIHDTYIHDVTTEAMYIGSGKSQINPSTTLEGVEIHDNRIERTGWDGIQVRSAVSNVKVYDNYIHTTGVYDDGVQACAGLEIGEDAVGLWYNNLIVNAVVGIWTHYTDNFHIYNNTVVQSVEKGIKVRGIPAPNAKIYNNLVAESGRVHLDTAEAETFNNLAFDTIEEVKFVDPATNDYHLQADSPAVDTGFVGDFALVDLEGISRPQGNGPDVGAFEFTNTSPIPPPNPSPTFTPTPPSSGPTISFTPLADTFVNANKPTINFGKMTILSIDGSPTQVTYLKFDLSGLSAAEIISAKLRLFVVNSSSATQNIKLVGNSWSETALTFNNRPIPTTVIASVNGGAVNSWIQVDLTSAIKTHAGQTLSLALDATGDNGLDVNSKEANTNQPHLLIVTNKAVTSAANSITAPELDPNSATLVVNHPASVGPGETFEVSIEAQNMPGNGLYGVQFELNYDPNMISTGHLQIHPDLSFVVLNSADNVAGKIRVVASRQGHVPGLTGNVTLLTFDATAANIPGLATFAFENEKISDHSAQPIEAVAHDGSISIGEVTIPEPTDEPTPEPTGEPILEPTDEPILDPTEEPAPEPTDEPLPVPTDQPVPKPTVEPAPEPTDEPLPVPTDQPVPEPTVEPAPEPIPVPTDQPVPEPIVEPTPEPTGEPATAVVFGQVILAGQANTNWSEAVVAIEDTGQNATTDTAGGFNIANVIIGPHTSITADAPGYLSATCTAPTVIAPETGLASITLLSGDISDDNIVDIADATTVGVSFGFTGPDLAADLNRDNIVDIFDIVLVSLNFGQAGPQKWVCQ